MQQHDSRIPLKTIEFSNCGIGDGQFLTRHCNLITGLKQFDENSFQLQVFNIPGANLGGYNYKLDVYKDCEKFELFLKDWAAPNKLTRPLNFDIIKKK